MKNFLLLIIIIFFSVSLKAEEIKPFYDENLSKNIILKHYNKKRNSKYFDILNENNYIFKLLKNKEKFKNENNQ